MSRALTSALRIASRSASINHNRINTSMAALTPMSTCSSLPAFTVNSSVVASVSSLAVMSTQKSAILRTLELVGFDWIDDWNGCRKLDFFVSKFFGIL